MDDTTLFWAVVFWAFCSRRGEQASPAPSPEPSTPETSPPWPAPTPGVKPADIGEGWWWYWYPNAQSERVQAVLDKELRRARRRKSNRRWEIRKTMGGTSLGATVIVFFVFEPFRWELEGLPQRAPRGLDTDLVDVAGAIPDPPTLLRQLAQVIMHETWEYLRELYLGRPPPDPF